MAININEVKRRLKTLLKDDALVFKYIRTYGSSIDIKNVQAIRDGLTPSQVSAKKKKNNDVSMGSSNDPVFEIKVKCPVCNKKEITSYQLKAKSQDIEFNKFLVPTYKKTQNYMTVNYSYIYVTVCPRCFFASPDSNDFVKWDIVNQKYKKSQINSSVLLTLQEKMSERQELGSDIADPEDFFSRPRNFDAAIKSIDFAIIRAKAEAYYKIPYANFKLGSYYLRIAHLEKELKKNNSDNLKLALKYFEEAFKGSNSPSEDIEMKTIYLIFSLYLKFGEEGKANSYLGALKNIQTQRKNEMKEDPSLKLNTIKKWLDKSQNLWSDRDMEDLFDKE